MAISPRLAMRMREIGRCGGGILIKLLVYFEALDGAKDGTDKIDRLTALSAIDRYKDILSLYISDKEKRLIHGCSPAPP